MTFFPLKDAQLATMRRQAELFFTEPVEIYNLTLTYDEYGQQIVTSGLVASVSGYVGAVKGYDRELFARLVDNTIGQRDGWQTKLVGILLVPKGTPLDTRYAVHISGQVYTVIWENIITQNSVQLYEKAFLVKYIEIDELEFRYYK